MIRALLTLLASLMVVSCASGGGRGSSADSRTQVASNAEVPDELSLKADRSALDEERKDIPEDKRRDNDELAALLQLIQAKPNQEPGEVRERFNKVIRDRREKSDKTFRRRREEFSKTETRSRESFLKTAKDERDSYLKSKHTSDDRKDFFDRQEDQRKSFFSDQTEKRNDFEAKMTDDRKTFEDYIKEKTSQFNDEMRAYTAAYYDRQKGEALAKEAKSKARVKSALPSSRAGQADHQDEIETIPQGPSIPLGPPSDERQ
jgi:hypothetical protein